jgi:hypothetical protein
VFATHIFVGTGVDIGMSWFCCRAAEMVSIVHTRPATATL